MNDESNVCMTCDIVWVPKEAYSAALAKIESLTRKKEGALKTEALQSGVIAGLQMRNVALERETKTLRAELGNALSAGRAAEQVHQRVRAELDAAKVESDDEDTLRQMMADLLTGTANALKGEPGPLSGHGWQDLPLVAKAAMSALQEAVSVCRSAHEIALREGKETNWHGFRKRVINACTPAQTFIDDARSRGETGEKIG